MTRILTAFGISVFDTNGDGVLDASDASHADPTNPNKNALDDFKLMVTQDDGSMVTMSFADLGIESINLVADTTNIELPDGSVITGQTSYTKSDGSEGLVGDAATAVLSDRTETTRSADGLVTTILRDHMGGNWFDQSEVRTRAANDDSLTIVISELDFTGAVIRSTTKLVSADGLTRTDLIDEDEGGISDHAFEHTVSVAGTLRTETSATRNGGEIGSLRSQSIEVIDERLAETTSRTIKQDADGDGYFETKQIYTITVNADESTTSILLTENEDGAQRGLTEQIPRNRLASEGSIPPYFDLYL